MKKILFVLSLSIVSVICISCATQPTQSFLTGTGTAEGYNGPIEVVVKVQEGRIIDASIITITDTATIGVPAAKLLIAEAVETGSAENLDIVAGATISSKAVIQALKQAVAAAHQ